MTGHAYTVLGSASFTEVNGQKWDVIKMRNPYAKEGYWGAWNDMDGRWTPKLKQLLGLQDLNDGVFFLPVQTFKRAFPFYYIGMY